MLEGLYSAAAGLMAQQERLDAIANDVANVNTNAYKRVRVAFRDLAYQQPCQADALSEQIGADLCISPGTVHKHLEHVYAKLGVDSRAAVVTRAFERLEVTTS